MGILEICLALLCLLLLSFVVIATLSLAASPAGRECGAQFPVDAGEAASSTCSRDCSSPFWEWAPCARGGGRGRPGW